mmetsp:Transcript_32096/g.74486  ORF Transcript_32096/g.74486 Transcript_32096/m.74486 type:complete len:203 (+) Transcript_32096:185-793(+)
MVANPSIGELGTTRCKAKVAVTNQKTSRHTIMPHRAERATGQRPAAALLSASQRRYAPLARDRPRRYRRLQIAKSSSSSSETKPPPSEAPDGRGQPEGGDNSWAYPFSSCAAAVTRQESLTQPAKVFIEASSTVLLAYATLMNFAMPLKIRRTPAATSLEVISSGRYNSKLAEMSLFAPASKAANHSWSGKTKLSPTTTASV